MGGIVGRLFREFAATLAVAVAISLVVSLTTTPMMCALVLRHRPGGGPAPRRAGGPRALSQALTGLLDRMGGAGQRFYARSLDTTLRHPVLTLLVLLATVVANVGLYIHVNKGFFPQQDTGLVMGGVQADQSISFQAMSAKLDAFMAIVQADPAVDNVNGFTGGGQTNSANVFVILKPLAQRGGLSTDAVINRLRPKLARVAGAALFLQSAQDLRIGGRQSNAQYQYTLQSDELSALRTWEPRIKQILAQLPELADVNTDAQDKGLDTLLAIDRASASRLGLTMQQIDATLSDAFSQRQVSTIYQPLNQYHVIEEAAPRFWQRPESLRDVMLMGPNAAQIPLSAVAHWDLGNAPLAVNHQGQFPATTLSFNLAPGVSLGAAATAINTAMARNGVPAAIRGGFQGNAKAFQDSLARCRCSLRWRCSRSTSCWACCTRAPCTR